MAARRSSIAILGWTSYVWKNFERYLNDVRSLQGGWTIFERMLNSVWSMFELCLIYVWAMFELCLKYVTTSPVKKTLQEQHSRRFRDICAAGFQAWLAFEGPEQDWTLDTKYWSLDTSRPVRVGRVCWRSLYTNFREIHNFFEFFLFLLWWGQHLDRFRMHQQRSKH